MRLHHKDLGILTSAARDAGVTIPLGATAAQLMGALVAQGHGDLDNTALLRLVEDLSGRVTEQNVATPKEGKITHALEAGFDPILFT